MPKVSVYLPDDLVAQVRAAELSLSRITQKAVREALQAFANDGRVFAAIVAGDRGPVTVMSALGARLIEVRSATVGPIVMDDVQAAHVSDALKRAVEVAEGRAVDE